MDQKHSKTTCLMSLDASAGAGAKAATNRSPGVTTAQWTGTFPPPSPLPRSCRRQWQLKGKCAQKGKECLGPIRYVISSPSGFVRLCCGTYASTACLPFPLLQVCSKIARREKGFFFLSPVLNLLLAICILLGWHFGRLRLFDFVSSTA